MVYFLNIRGLGEVRAGISNKSHLSAPPQELLVPPEEKAVHVQIWWILLIVARRTDVTQHRNCRNPGVDLL